MNRLCILFTFAISTYSSILIDQLLFDDNDTPQIKVFASDDNLKALGELLSNDSSRNIIYNLMNKEMYTNEISTKLDMRVSLVIHHLRKLEDLDLLEITEKKIKRKGVEHRFFKIKSNIFVVIDKDKKEIEEKGLLKKIFNEGIKFTSIGFVTLGTYLITKPELKDELVFASSKDINLTIPLIILVIGLICERVYVEIKKKKEFRTNRK